MLFAGLQEFHEQRERTNMNAAISGHDLCPGNINAERSSLALDASNNICVQQQVRSSEAGASATSHSESKLRAGVSTENSVLPAENLFFRHSDK
jgi:hypothetical protein